MTLAEHCGAPGSHFHHTQTLTHTHTHKANTDTVQIHLSGAVEASRLMAVSLWLAQL